jgi:3-mercaptopyruvate sulfurtransferase SseA
VSHFWHDDLVTTGSTTVWKPIETLRANYLAQGITPDKYIIIYCNTGTEASHAYFALKLLLGYPDVRCTCRHSLSGPRMPTGRSKEAGLLRDRATP